MACAAEDGAGAILYALYVSWLCVVAPSGSMLGSQILISRVKGPGRPVPVLGPWRGLRVGALAAATESPAPSARRVYASSGAIAGVAANAASLGGMGVSSTPSVAGDAAGVSERRESGLGEAAARTEMKHRSAVLCGQARVVHSVSECVSTSMRRYFEVETADPRGACKYSKKKLRSLSGVCL